MIELEMTGAALRAIRQRLGLTQEALAAALGYPDPANGGRTRISKYESGRRPIPEPGVLERALRDLERELAPS